MPIQRPVSGHCSFLPYREGVLAAAGSIIMLAGLAAPAHGFSFFQGGGPSWGGWQGGYARPAKPARSSPAPRDNKDAKKEEERPENVAAKAKGVLSIFISLDRQKLTLYSDGQPIAHTRVSTGTPGHPTPTGVFSVIQKDRWHRSNLYGDAPMFYMQRLTWSGVAMHQGVVPNSPASHGCIRLPEAFARQLWGITKLGVRVVIARGELSPVAVSHARLFTYKQESLEARGEPTSPADVVKDAHGVVQLGTKRSGTASDVSKPADPALDAMAYAMGKAHEAPATSSDVVKSAYDPFDLTNARRLRNVTNNGVVEVRPLRPGPVSVFISRKEGKLFVRKGFEPLFSVPVTFEQPDKPLGTHVFTALALNEDNTTMRWNVVSMPRTPGGMKQSEKGKPAQWIGPSSSATEALERVTIPLEAIDRISELMSPGASLLISDQGLGPETGQGTDFIVLTR
jgi:L,D-transpeptidase catalytic domain